MTGGQKKRTTNATTGGEPFDFLIGEVVGFRGLRGEIKIRPGTNNPSLLLPVEQVEIETSGKPRQLVGVKSIALDRRILMMILDEYPDRTAVEKLKGARLYCQASCLAPLDTDEWWVDDLIGLKAFTSKGEHIGTVCEVYGERGDFLEILLSDSNKKVLVPFVKEIVPLVDVKSGRLEIEALPGLLD
ncbi:MAG: ribosome maturation factor RimM [Candidatus Obscuribacterales bacterium]